MATIRELQAKFTASTKGMRTAVKGVVDDLKGMQKETQKVNKETQKTATDSKDAYRTMADGSKVYRDSMGKLRDEMGRFVQEQDTILQNASRSQKFFDGLGNSAITAGNKVQSISTQINSVGNVARDFGGTLTKYVTAPVAGLATLLGGTAITKGWQRLVGIDTAKAKLEGLGHSTENVETIMDNALESVKGTAFGMGDAATTAASAVAAGIDPGKELTRYLTLTGDAAAIAGTNLGEMGPIFNKIQTSNKAYNDSLGQLSERGLPIYQWLAEEAGVAEDAVFDMASNGEISSKMFLDAIESNIGGAAAIMGEKSFTAAWDNMWASVGRIGANFLDAGGKAGGFFSQVKPILSELTELFSGLEDKAADWGVKFGQTFANTIEWIRDFIGQLKALDDWQKKLIGWGAAIAVALGPILTVLGSIAIFISKVGFAIAPLITGFGKMSKAVADAGGLMVWLRGGLTTLAKRFSFLLGPVGIAVGIILTLGTAFVTAYKKSETFRNFIDGLKDRFVDAWQSAMEFKDKVVTAFEGIFAIFKGDHTSANELLRSIGLSEDTIDNIFLAVNRIQAAYEALKENVQTNIENIKTFFIERFEQIKSWWDSTGSGIFSGITDRFNQVKEGVSDALSGVFDFFKDTFEDINAWWTSDGALIFSAVQTVFEKTREKGEQAWSVLAKAVEIGIDVITNAIEYFAPIVMGIFDLLWPTIVFLTQTAWEKLKLVIGVAMDLIQGIISGVAALIEGDWSKFGEIMKETALSIKDRVVEFFGNMKDNAVEYVNQLTGGAIDKFIEMKNSVIESVVGFKDGVVSRFTELKDGAIGKVTEAYDGITGWFSELHTGITTKVTETKDSVVGKFTEIKDGAIQRVTEMVAPIIEPFQNIYDGVKTRMEQLGGILSYIFNLMKNTIVLIVTTIYNQVAQWFSNMYTRVSTIASNIYTWVRDRFNSLRDTVVDTVSNLYERVSTWFMSLYTRVSTIVSNVRNWVVQRFNSLRDTVVNTVSNLYNRVTTWFSNLYNRLSTIVNNVRNRVSEIFGNLRDRVVNTVSNLYDRVSSWFTNIYNTIRDKMRDAKDKAVGFATDLYDGAKAQFENLSSAASDMMDKIGQWIDDKKEAVVGKAKSLGIDIANGAINGFNKMIGGINNVADLLGYDGTLISEIPTYSTGTNYHPGGAAIVGDKGPGNSVGGGGSSTREIIELPNGKRFLADGNVLIPNAPRGMKVKNNRATEKELSGGSGSNVFSRTAKNIGDFAKSTTDKVVTGTKNAVGKVVDTADAVWEYAKNPGALLDDIIGSIDFALPTEALELAKLGLGKLKSIATDYIKELFSGAEGAGDGSHILGKQIYQYFGRYGIGGSLGLNFNAGKHYGLDTAHKHEPLLSPINGVVTRIWNDYGGGNSLQVDAGKYTWWFMHLSKVLASLGERITTGQKIAITGATGNFISGSGHLHTQVMEGGVGNAYAIDPLPILKNLKGAGSAVTGVASKVGGYFRGGITSGFPELAWLNEEGFRESIISHNPAHRERSESIWQTTGDKLGFGKNDEELKLMREENALLKQIVINTGDTADNTEEIKHKNPKIVIDEYEKKRDRRRDDTTIIY